MHELDHALHRVAAAQDNVVARQSLLSIGWTDRMIRRALASGWLRQLHPGVYLVGAAAPTWHQQLRSAVYAAGEGSLVSHRAALMLWGLDGIANAPVEITSPHSDRPVPRGVVLHRSRRIEPASVQDGIDVTGVERTLLELGAVVPPVVVEKAFSAAWRRNLTTPAKSRLYLEHHGGKGRSGTRLFREVVELYDDGQRPPGSSGEVAFLRCLRQAGIEEPVRQFLVACADGTKACVDFAWPERRKLIEFVGLETHADSRAHDHDTWRENLIRDAGWDLRRYAPESLRTRPEAVAAAVIRFLGRSTYRSGR